MAKLTLSVLTHPFSKKSSFKAVLTHGGKEALYYRRWEYGWNISHFLCEMQTPQMAKCEQNVVWISTGSVIRVRHACRQAVQGLWKQVQTVGWITKWDRVGGEGGNNGEIRSKETGSTTAWVLHTMKTPSSSQVASSQTHSQCPAELPMHLTHLMQWLNWLTSFSHG